MTIEFTGSRIVRYEASDLGVIQLAYAMTVHKAMGSEFSCIIIPLLSAHTIMHYRNFIYTAVTRAIKRVYLVGQRSALFLAIHRSKIDRRHTQLGSRIQAYHKELPADAHKRPA